MQVSRRHARLEVVAGHLELTDLGAVNGTYVNGARIETGSRRYGEARQLMNAPSGLSWVQRVECLRAGCNCVGYLQCL